MSIVGHFLADFADFFTKATQAEKQIADLDAESKKLDTTTKSFGSSAASVFGGLGGYIAGAFSVGALVAFGKELIDDADAIQRMSDQTGIGVVQLQKLQAIADESGNTVDQLTGAISAMQNRIGEGNTDALAALSKLGIGLDDLRAKAPDEQFMMIARAVREIEDPIDRARTAMELFGKAGAQILPSLRADVDAIAEGTATMTEEQIKQLDALGDAWQRLWTRIKVGAAAALVPVEDTTDAMIRRLQKIREIEQGGLPDTIGLEIGIDHSLPTTGKGSPLAVPGLPPPEVIAASDRAMKALGDTVRANLAEQKAAQDAAARYAESWANVSLAIGGYQDVLATVNGATVEAIKYALDLGASQRDLAEVYQLSAQQIAAIAKSRDVDIAALKLQQAAEQAYGAQILATAREIEAARENERKQLEGDTSTRDYYQRMMTEAQQAYDFAKDHASSYTQARLDQLEQEAQAARTNFEEWTQVATQSAEDVKNAAGQAADAIGSVNDQLAAQQKALNSFVGASFPTSESLAAAALNPGSMLGLGGIPTVRSLPTGLSPYNPLAQGITIQSGAIAMNYPIVNDPQALDQLGRLVGTAILQQQTRQGVRLS